MSAKKRKPDEGHDQDRAKMIGLRPDHKLLAVLEILAARERRPLATQCLLLVEEALQARGLWTINGGDEGGEG